LVLILCSFIHRLGGNNKPRPSEFLSTCQGVASLIRCCGSKCWDWGRCGTGVSPCVVVQVLWFRCVVVQVLWFQVLWFRCCVSVLWSVCWRLCAEVQRVVDQVLWTGVEVCWGAEVQCCGSGCCRSAQTIDSSRITLAPDLTQLDWSRST
jgi:hypothetical protein